MSVFDRFKEKMSRMWMTLRRFKKSHPYQLMVLGVFIGVLSVQIALVVSSYRQETQSRSYIEGLPKITLQELSGLANAGKVKTVVSHEVKMGSWLYPQERSYLEIVDTANKSHAWERTSNSVLGEEFGKMLFQSSAKHPVEFRTGAVIVPNALSGMITTAVLLFCVLMLITYGQKMAAEVLGGHSFKAEKPDMSTTLDDVVGYDDVKRQLRELKDQLLNANAYAQQGIVAPRGVLFTGDPGVGKTLMARAFANELGADFYSCTGADFAEMYVGVGPRRVRSLFHLARMASVAVIFIDEIDALGSRDHMGNDSERLSTLNAMLAEMDGVNGNHRLVVIGATNHAHRLDAALCRPGRFDHTIHIPLPDASTREGILRHYLKRSNVAKNVDLRALALRTQGYSGAALKNMVLEAIRLAARQHKDNLIIKPALLLANQTNKHAPWEITQELLHQAQEVATLGVTENRSDGADLVRVAVHELGHALVGYLHCPDMHIEKVTVEGRGGALGYAWTRPVDENKLPTEKQLYARIMMLLAGRAAEEEVFQDVSGGAADDIAKANDLARLMVVDYGMYPADTTGEKWANLSRQNVGADGRAALTEDHEDRIHKLLGNAYHLARCVVCDNKQWLEKSVQTLMSARTLQHNELFEQLTAKKEAIQAGTYTNNPDQNYHGWADYRQYLSVLHACMGPQWVHALVEKQKLLAAVGAHHLASNMEPQTPPTPRQL